MTGETFGGYARTDFAGKARTAFESTKFFGFKGEWKEVLEGIFFSLKDRRYRFKKVVLTRSIKTQNDPNYSGYRFLLAQRSDGVMFFVSITYHHGIAEEDYAKIAGALLRLEEFADDATDVGGVLPVSEKVFENEVIESRA